MQACADWHEVAGETGDAGRGARRAGKAVETGAEYGPRGRRIWCRTGDPVPAGTWGRNWGILGRF